MPIILSSAQEQLKYTPDQFATQGMQPGIAEALQQLVTQVQAMERALQQVRGATGSDQAAAIADMLNLELAVPDVLQAAAAEATIPHEEDAVFFYRRVPGNKRAALAQKHTINGLLASEPFWWEMGYEAMTGWNEYVQDGDGQPVPFSKAAIQYIPGMIVGRIGTLADNQAPLELITKNWHGTSNGVSPLPV